MYTYGTRSQRGISYCVSLRSFHLRSENSDQKSQWGKVIASVVQKLTHDTKRGKREKKPWVIIVSHLQKDADTLKIQVWKIKLMMMEEENIFVTWGWKGLLK